MGDTRNKVLFVCLLGSVTSFPHLGVPLVNQGPQVGPLTPAFGDLVQTPRGLRPISLEGFSEDLNQDGYVDPVGQAAVAPAVAAPAVLTHNTVAAPAVVGHTAVAAPTVLGHTAVAAPALPAAFGATALASAPIAATGVTASIPGIVGTHAAAVGIPAVAAVGCVNNFGSPVPCAL